MRSLCPASAPAGRAAVLPRGLVCRSRRLAAASTPPTPVPHVAQELLKGTSVFVVGDSHERNEETAVLLAAALGYATVSCGTTLELLNRGRRWRELEESVAVLGEAQALEELSSIGRVVVATCGGGRGAAARGAVWRHLFAGCTVWLDVAGEAEESPQREAYALAEVRVQASASVPAAALAEQALAALELLLRKQPKLAGNKQLYIKLGARGDWPDIQPPGALPS